MHPGVSPLVNIDCNINMIYFIRWNMSKGKEWSTPYKILYSTDSGGGGEPPRRVTLHRGEGC